MATDEVDPCRYDKWGRWYPYEGKWMPSITSILKVNKGNALERWRERVGAEEADAVTTYSQKRGTIVHGIMEAICRGDKDIVIPVPASQKRLRRDVEMFVTQLSVMLRENLCEPKHLELRVTSEALWTAGRFDMVAAKYRGVPSIVDYKNKRKRQQRDWITDYFFQERFYAEGYYHATGEIVRQLVVLIAHEEYPQLPPQQFVADAGEYKLGLRAVRKRFEEIFQAEMGCSTREYIPPPSDPESAEPDPDEVFVRCGDCNGYLYSQEKKLLEDQGCQIEGNALVIACPTQEKCGITSRTKLEALYGRA